MGIAAAHDRQVLHFQTDRGGEVLVVWGMVQVLVGPDVDAQNTHLRPIRGRYPKALRTRTEEEQGVGCRYIKWGLWGRLAQMAGRTSPPSAGPAMRSALRNR